MNDPRKAGHAESSSSDDITRTLQGTETDGPLVDLESLQFEGAVEGGRLRRNVMVRRGARGLA